MTTTDKLAAFDAAIAAELPRVYHLEYDSHEICKHFAGKVRERLLAAHEESLRDNAEQAQRQPLIARARDEWHLDDGPVMWWGWSGDSLGWIGEPAWIGTPLDDDWPGYHTHWTPHPAMPAGATTGEQR